MITGDYSTLGLLVADNANVKSELDKLTQQVATGKVASSYGGLGVSAQSALDLQPQISQLNAQQNLINSVTGRLAVTQSALSQIASVTSYFAAQTDTLNGLSPAQVDSVATAARAALQQVAGLLDSTDGSTYVFAGTDSGNPPVPDPSQILKSGFYTQINAAVSGLSGTTDNAATVAATTLSVARSDAAGTSPFSAGIGPAPTVPVGGSSVQVGVVANANTLAQSAGPSTTGSYTRDLLRSLATLGSLSSAQLGSPGFGALVADTRTSLQGAVSALATESGALGNTQSALTAEGVAASDAATALRTQLSSVQDVDVAKALTDLSAVQTQLQASYKVIAAAQRLSLVQYL